ncbi:MAG: 5'/3'-nucleotidase SurE [Bacteroidetes bacterium]|nr:MAG: 5'/3'-nucleotidase SurE [Bacteroidota bacterium]
MATKRPYILVTNDDGITAKGLRILIETAKKFGEVLVVAPDSHQSAKSHSITQAAPIRFDKIAEENAYKEYSISGTPVDCVKLALHELSDRKPDLILSGINHGANTSVSVLYSGTMAAAIEGGLHNIKSIGFSVDNHSSEADFSPVIPYMEKIIKEVIEKELPDGVSLNVNFPDVTKVDIKGIKTMRGANGVWGEKFVPANDPHKRNFVWITGKLTNYDKGKNDTDLYFIEKGYVTVTPIKVDFNYYSFLEELSDWEFNS